MDTETPGPSGRSEPEGAGHPAHPGEWSALEVLDVMGPVAVLTAERDPGSGPGDFRLQYLNPAMAALLGRPASELRGTRLLDDVPRWDETGTVDACRHVLTTGEDFVGELPWGATPDGPTTLRVRVSPLGSDRLVLQAHAMSAHQLTGMDPNAGTAAGDAVVGVGHDGRIIVWSIAAERLYGYGADHVVGQDPSFLAPEEERAAQAEAIRNVLDGGTVAPFRTVRQRQNGERFPVEIALWPLHDEHGAVIGVASLHRDVTDEVTVEKALDTARQRLRAAMEAVPIPHIVLDALRDERGEIVDFVFVDLNEAACRYVRMTRDMLIGARLFDTNPGQAARLPMLAAVVETGEPVEIADQVYDQELLHQVRHYDVRVVKTGDGISITARDVTPD